ncbi:hypothetical protein [Kumtagia ephedrae]|uniref:hypothetical protein n=1 Tax=Kumtagia ephedrae TaxID=2116701 RepID=UPI0014027995|nr:hypothetical protein [Mesorhizobium ephedrae]
MSEQQNPRRLLEAVDVLGLGGIVLITSGTAMIYVPAVMIVCGTLLLCGAILLGRRS